MENDFEKFCTKQSENNEHANEIRNTRIGGLGGSDAAMVLRIGMNGLAAATNTDMKRLAVMCGLIEPDNFGGNAYTASGHMFEDWYEDYIVRKAESKATESHGEIKPLFVNGSTYEREFVMGQTLARNFKTFAHADFAFGNFMNPTIVECKFVTTKTTDKVIDTYMPQLQWYYMLGAKDVHLLHGTGTVEDEQAGTKFEVEDGSLVFIPRDENMIKYLLAGIKIIDKALADGWLPVVRERIALADTARTIRDAFHMLESAKRKAQEAKDEEAQAKTVLSQFMSDLGYSCIADEEGGHVVSTVAAKTTTRFDLRAFKANLTKEANGDDGAVFTIGEVLAMIDKAQKTSTTEATVMFK